MYEERLDSNYHPTLIWRAHKAGLDCSEPGDPDPSGSPGIARGGGRKPLTSLGRVENLLAVREVEQPPNLRLDLGQYLKPARGAAGDSYQRTKPGRVHELDPGEVKADVGAIVPEIPDHCFECHPGSNVELARDAQAHGALISARVEADVWPAPHCPEKPPV